MSETFLLGKEKAMFELDALREIIKVLREISDEQKEIIALLNEIKDNTSQPQLNVWDE